LRLFAAINRSAEDLGRKRVLLFFATNLAVMLVLSFVLNVLGVGRLLTGSGLDVTGLLLFALVIGFVGSFISLLISKPMAKWTTGTRVIGSPRNSTEQWLVDTVRDLAHRAEIGMRRRSKRSSVTKFRTSATATW
jgi:heat shock protein HtpX